MRKNDAWIWFWLLCIAIGGSFIGWAFGIWRMGAQ